MTHTHDKARKALAKITAIEGVTKGPWTSGTDPSHFDAPEIIKGGQSYYVGIKDADAAHMAACDPATMQAIAALVAHQDAQIAVLEEALESIVNKPHEQPRTPDWSAHAAWYDRALKECQDIAANAMSLAGSATEAAKAYEARIRADERERHLSIIQKYRKDNGAQSEWDNEGAAMEVACVEISDAIRAMGGNADE